MTLLPPKSSPIDEQIRGIIGKLLEGGIPLKQAMEEFRKKYIEEALRYHKKNVSKTAQALGVHRNTLYHYMKNGKKD